MLVVGGCFSPDLPDVVTCGTHDECPMMTHCEATTSTCVPDATPKVAALRFVTPPPGSVEALAEVPTLRIELVDASGTVVSISGASVSLVLDAARSGAQLVGTTVRPSVNGAVDFSGLRYDRPGRGLRLEAHVGALMVASSPFDVTFSRPSITLGAVPEDVEGCATIPYTLKQAQGRAIDLLVEVDPDGPDGALPFHRATQAASPAGSAGVQGAPSSAAGRSQTFSWNTSADVAAKDQQVTVRLTPHLGEVAGNTVTLPVSVHNGTRWVTSDTAVPGLTGAQVIDLDRDGWNDVISLAGNDVTVRYGGAGGVVASVTLARPARDVVAGDFDADGLLDLAVATDGAGLQILRQLRAPRRQLSPASTLAMGTSVRQVVVSDLDHDGLLDLVLVDADSAEVTAFRQSAAASTRFAALGSLWHDGATGRIAVLDHPREGSVEVVVGRPGAEVAFVTLHGLSIDAPRLDEFLVGAEVAVVDLNGDMRSDVVALAPDGLRAQLGGVSPTNVGPLADVVGEVPSFGDVNDDGRPDIVLEHGGALEVRLSEQPPPGGPAVAFAAPIAFPGTASPSRPSIADVDRDGRADVVVPRPGAGLLTTLRFDGARRCGARLGGPLATGARALPDWGNGITPVDGGYMVVDMNGDGKPDIVQIDTVDGHYGVAISSGRGDGSFEPQKLAIETDAMVQGFSVGDLDGDGFPDLVYPAYFGSTIKVLFNDPAMPGTFQEKLVVGQGCDVAIADVDADGLDDLVVISFGKTTIYRASAADRRSFGDPVTLPLVAMPEQCSRTTRLRVVDLDGDGRREIVIIETDQQVVYPTDPGKPGAFLDPVVSEHSESEFVAIADVTGDSKPELVLGRYAPGSIYGLEGYSFDESWETSDAPDWRVSVPTDTFKSRITTAGVADLDHDGRTELAISIGPYGIGGVLLLTPRDLATGSTLTLDRSIPVDGRPAFADVDADGVPDLLTGSYVVRAIDDHGDFDAGLLLGRVGADLEFLFDPPRLGAPEGPSLAAFSADGATVAAWSCSRPSGPCTEGPTFPSTRSILVADLNHDGRPDALGHGEGQLAFVADGDDAFAAVCAGTPTLVERAVGDLDLDGRPDLVVTSGLLVQWIAAPASTCSPPQTLVTLPSAMSADSLTAVRLVDMNADGFLDLVISGKGALVALQSADVPLSFPTLTTYGTDAFALAIGDVDRDGLPDMVLQGGPTTVLYLNNLASPGTLTIGPALPGPPSAPYETWDLADADGDGWLDLYASGSGAVLLQDSQAPTSFGHGYGVSTGTFYQNASSSAMIDFDGDGHLDLLTWRYERGLYLNRGM
jgi:hypothetical protein